MDIEQFFLENALSANTEDRYRRALIRISAAYDLQQLTAAQFKLHLTSQGWGSSTQWINFCAVKRFLRWKYGDSHPALMLKIRREDSPPQRSLSEAETLRLLASFSQTTVKGCRDLAICTLMLDSGLRCSEVCSLDLARLDLEAGSIQVKIKGGRWALAVFSEPTAAYLTTWISIRSDVLNCDSPALFVSLGGLHPLTRLTRAGLGLTIRRWGIRIGLPLSPHDLRRTFAELSTTYGAPSRTLQIAGRWKDIKMVERYTRNITAKAFRHYFPVAGVIGV